MRRGEEEERGGGGGEEGGLSGPTLGEMVLYI